MNKSQLIEDKLSLKNEKPNVARILTLTKKQAHRMTPELKEDFNLLEMWGLMKYKNTLYEVTFDTKDLKINYLFPNGDYSNPENNRIEAHLNDEDMDYIIKHAGLLRLSLE